MSKSEFEPQRQRLTEAHESPILRRNHPLPGTNRRFHLRAGHV